MSKVYWLSDREWARIEPLLPRGRKGAHRVDDRRVISGIVHMLRSGARWRDCPDPMALTRRSTIGSTARADRAFKGRGLGWRPMQHIIDYAKSEGLHELHGAVLAENSTMLRMCAELGFSVEEEPGDNSLRRVVLTLG